MATITIKQELYNKVLGDNTPEMAELISDNLMESVLIPLIRKSFDAGVAFGLDSHFEVGEAPNCEEWITKNIY